LLASIGETNNLVEDKVFLLDLGVDINSEVTLSLELEARKNLKISSNVFVEFGIAFGDEGFGVEQFKEITLGFSRIFSEERAVETNFAIHSFLSRYPIKIGFRFRSINFDVLSENFCNDSIFVGFNFSAFENTCIFQTNEFAWSHSEEILVVLSLSIFSFDP